MTKYFSLIFILFILVGCAGVDEQMPVIVGEFQAEVEEETQVDEVEVEVDAEASVGTTEEVVLPDGVETKIFSAKAIADDAIQLVFSGGKWFSPSRLLVGFKEGEAVEIFVYNDKEDLELDLDPSKFETKIENGMIVVVIPNFAKDIGKPVKVFIQGMPTERDQLFVISSPITDKSTKLDGSRRSAFCIVLYPDGTVKFD